MIMILIILTVLISVGYYMLKIHSLPISSISVSSNNILTYQELEAYDNLGNKILMKISEIAGEGIISDSYHPVNTLDGKVLDKTASFSAKGLIVRNSGPKFNRVTVNDFRTLTSGKRITYNFRNDKDVYDEEKFPFDQDAKQQAYKINFFYDKIRPLKNIKLGRIIMYNIEKINLDFYLKKDPKKTVGINIKISDGKNVTINEVYKKYVFDVTPGLMGGLILNKELSEKYKD